MKVSLDGRVALVTGGSRGIGRATALACAALGWRTVVGYGGNHAAAEATVAAVTAAGGRAVAVAGDVSREADVVALFDAAQEAFGGVDALVNNAGIVAPARPLTEISRERMERMIGVNLLGPLLCAREAARRLPEGGAIVNVSSIAARLGAPNEYVDYAATKGAVDSLTVGLAKELAPRRIRVNAVRPGTIETEIHASAGDPGRAERVGRLVPLRRPGTAEEIASAIAWLLDDRQSGYVTGTLLDVTGGR